MTPVVRELFEIRANSYFDTNIVSLGALPSICKAPHKYYFLITFTHGIMTQVPRPMLHYCEA